MSLSIRHDFYQSDEKISISIYKKGLKKEDVSVKFESRALSVILPDATEKIEPLFAEIEPEQSRYTVSAVKIEVTLQKKVPAKWTALNGNADASSSTTPHPLPKPTTMPVPAGGDGKKKAKKNWDSLVEDELKEPEEAKDGPKDPNAGGEGELQKLFAKIYADADEDTRRAMNKSFVESKGTSLSTDWSTIGKSKTEVKAPEGMEPVDF